MSDIELRKKQHLDLCLHQNDRNCGLEQVHLPYDATFHTADESLNTQSSIAGIPIRFPLMFGAMTGGTEFAKEFNTLLRRLASQYGLAMCLGSMRAVLNYPGLISTYGSGHVEALFANIGASEIDIIPSVHIAETCKRMGACGLFIHLNGIQEFVQPEGNKNFTCQIDDLKHFIEGFPLPVFIKEVGSGIGKASAQMLCGLPIAGIETSSLGGTSWIKIENARRSRPLSPESLESLCAIGYSLIDSIKDLRQYFAQRTIIASGGIHTPLEIIKSLYLGADLVSIAQPIYQIYRENGPEELERRIHEWLEVSRLIWRSTGAKDIQGLKKAYIEA